MEARADWKAIGQAIGEASAIADPGRRAAALRPLCLRHDLAPAWFNYASALLELGDEAGAQRALLRSLALDPGQAPLLPPRLRALVFEPEGRSAPQAAQQAAPAPPRDRAAAAMPAPVDLARTLVDPVESRIGKVVAGGLRLEALLQRTDSQALFSARGPGGPLVVRLLPGVPAAAALAAFRSDQRLPAVPGVGRVVDVVTDQDTPLQIIEGLAGRPLSEVLRAGRLEPPAAVAVVRAVSQAVAELAQHGVVAGDVHPESVFLDEAGGRTALLGVGGAARAGAGVGATVASLPSHLHWTVPEEFLGVASPARAQVYNLGLLLLTCLTGVDVPPLAERKEGGEAWIDRVLVALPAAVARQAWARALLPVLRRSLSAAPGARQATPAELASALAAATQGAPELSRAVQTLFDPGPPAATSDAAQARPRSRPPSRPVGPPPDTGRLWAVVIGAAAIVGMAAGLLLKWLQP